MKKILIVITTYLPGYKAGGPVRSIANLVEYLGSEYEFYILTLNRDLNETTPYEGIVPEHWTDIGCAKIFYTADLSMDLIERMSHNMDIVYQCGCFSDDARYVFLLHRSGRINARVIVASMGLFANGAFRIKYVKKKLYMMLTNALGFYRGVEWSASTEDEAANIKRQVWGKLKYHIAKDLPRTVRLRTVMKQKQANELDVVFLSRISREKNLAYAVEVLSCINRGKIHFSVIGVMEDKQYWKECMDLLEKLPDHITWEYKGAISSEDVLAEFEKHQVFLFPTLGENYGHVIQEALSAGCISIISDQTPWGQLADCGVGADLPLDRQELWVECLQKYLDMDEQEFQNHSNQAIQFAYDNSDIEQLAQKYRDMFEDM